MPNPADLHEHITTVVDFAARSSKEYEATKEWTVLPSNSCMTVRVPVALLHRIRELGEALQREGVAAA